MKMRILTLCGILISSSSAAGQTPPNLNELQTRIQALEGQIQALRSC